MSDWMTRWNEFQKSAEKCFRFLKVEDLMHASHISLKNKYLYVETAKVGCSSVKKLLIDAEYERKVAPVEGEYLILTNIIRFKTNMRLRQMNS